MLGSAKIDWLPTEVAGAQVNRISSFIDTTLEEHAALMARLQEGGHADDAALQPIKLPHKVLPWKNAIFPLIDVVKDIEEVRTHLGIFVVFFLTFASRQSRQWTRPLKTSTTTF